MNTKDPIEKTTLTTKLPITHTQIPDNLVPNKPFAGYCRKKGMNYWFHSSDSLNIEGIIANGFTDLANNRQFKGGNKEYFDYAVEIGSETWNRIFNKA